MACGVHCQKQFCWLALGEETWLGKLVLPAVIRYMERQFMRLVAEHHANVCVPVADLASTLLYP